MNAATLPLTSAEKRPSAKLLLFWDYDTQWGADRSRSVGGPKQWGHLEFVHTERLIEIHENFDIKACFAVVGAAAHSGSRPYYDPKQIRLLHESGHEIASHTYQHDWLPGLTHQELINTLRSSRDALEECISAPVWSFVPPYNQPNLYPQRLAPSFSEFRYAGIQALTIPRLCEALSEVGYRFARVSYFPLHEYVLSRFFSVGMRKVSRAQKIAGITCVRLNTPCGFGPHTLELLKVGVEHGDGLVVVYAHPHALSSGGYQDEKYLIPFFECVNELRRENRLSISLPRDLLRESEL